MIHLSLFRFLSRYLLSVRISISSPLITLWQRYTNPVQSNKAINRYPSSYILSNPIAETIHIMIVVYKSIPLHTSFVLSFITTCIVCHTLPLLVHWIHIYPLHHWGSYYILAHSFFLALFTRVCSHIYYHYYYYNS